MNESLLESVIISQAKILAKEKLELRMYSTGKTPSDTILIKNDETSNIVMFTVVSRDLHLDDVEIRGFITGDGIIIFTALKFKEVEYFYPNFTPFS